MAKPPERPEPPPPRTNSFLIGHGAAEERLTRWLAEDRLPHALMLCGPWGIGKATLAFRLARTLLRQTGQMALAADAASGVVERLVLVQPHLPFFEFPEPALDEGLALGVAVAAAAVADAEIGEPRPEAASGEGGAVLLRCGAT